MAKVLRLIARGPASKTSREKHMDPLIEKLQEINIEPFFSALCNVDDIKNGLPVNIYLLQYLQTIFPPHITDNSYISHHLVL